MDQFVLGSDGAVTFSPNEAKAAAAGYAFGLTELSWSPPSAVEERGPAPVGRPRRWAYRSFDCLPTTSGPWRDWELLAATGLDAPPSSGAINTLLEIRDDVWAALTIIPPSVSFDQLDATDVSEICPGGYTRHLMRARPLLYGVNGLGTAGVHKLLHHKRPHLCPLVDNLTLPLLQGRSWSGAQIHHDLRVNANQFAELERWFAELVASQNPENVPLSRLRLHDILMWLHAASLGNSTDHRGEAIKAGEGFV